MGSGGSKAATKGVQTSASAFHAAAQAGDAAQVKALLNNDPNRKDSAGNTGLHYAAAAGHVAAVKAIMQNSLTDPNIENSYHTTPLLLAAGNSEVSVMEALLGDARIHANQVTKDGFSALHLAAQRGRADTIGALLRIKSVSPNLASVPHLNTPLHLAAAAGKLKAAFTLCEHKAVMLHLKNKNGQTPEDVAIAAGHEDIAQMLRQQVKAKADLQSKQRADQRSVLEAKRKEAEAAAAAEAAANPAPEPPPKQNIPPSNAQPAAGTNANGYGMNGNYNASKGGGGLKDRVRVSGMSGQGTTGRGERGAAAREEEEARQLAQIEKTWVKLETSRQGMDITYVMIPWPRDDNQLLREVVSIGCPDDPDKRAQHAKQVYRKLTMRWHPDKFESRFGNMLSGADREKILDKVKRVSQAINRAWGLSMY